MLPYFLWSLWKERIDVTFNYNAFKPIRILIRAKLASAQWSLDRTSYRRPTNINKHTRTTNGTIFLMAQPQGGYVKLNVDGSIIRNNAVGGFLVRKGKGKLLQAEPSNLGNTSIIKSWAIPPPSRGG